MAKPRVLVMQRKMDDPAVFEPLREAGDVDILPAEQDVLEERLPDYDALLTELHLQLREPLIRKCPNLTIVTTCSTGTDHLDLKALEAAGIRLISLKNDTDFLADVPATAEMAWALLLAVYRRLPAAFDSVKRGEWDRMRFQGHQLFGKTIGILGFGRLGKIICKFALGFRMRVIANDIKDFAPPPGVEKVDLDTLIRESDILTVHIHLNEENYHFVNAERLALMKPEAVLINTSRGAVLDQTALLAALESGSLAGAGVDVLEGEFDGVDDHPMVLYAREHDNLVISPHIGGCTHESVGAAMAHTVAKLNKALLEFDS